MSLHLEIESRAGRGLGIPGQGTPQAERRTWARGTLLQASGGQVVAVRGRVGVRRVTLGFL